MNVIKTIFNNSADVECIKKSYISQYFREDKKIWAYSKNVPFTTKSAYNLNMKDNEQDGRIVINWRALWKLPLPQRVLMFGWKRINNTIQVHKRVKKVMDETQIS